MALLKTVRFALNRRLLASVRFGAMCRAARVIQCSEQTAARVH